MSSISFTIILAVLASFFAQPHCVIAQEGSYPQVWSGDTTVEEYCESIGLKKTLAVQINDAESLDLTLIPAATFNLGIAAPEKPERSFILYLSFGCLLTAFSIKIIRRIRISKRTLGLAGCIYVFFFASCFLGLIVSEINMQRRLSRYINELDLYNSADNGVKPSKRVTISKPFYIGVCEVTEKQFLSVTERNSWFGATGHSMKPIGSVSWGEANRFCKLLSQITGKRVRLPTEAEWEFSSRVGFSANSILQYGDISAWCRDNSKGTKQPCKSSVPNYLGLYEAVGNMWEWCNDRYSKNYVHDVNEIEPYIPWVEDDFEDEDRVLRGGSYLMPQSDVNPFQRKHGGRSDVSPEYGFRVVLELDVSAPPSPPPPK